MTARSKKLWVIVNHGNEAVETNTMELGVVAYFNNEQQVVLVTAVVG